ncbi:hypothetical protein CIHG_02503, partial [Coccidioides immitis H538.4]
QGIGKTAIFLRLKGAVIRDDPRTMDIRSMLGRMRLRALKGCIPPAEPGRHVVGQPNEFMRGLTSKARFKIATNNDVSSVAPPRSTPCSGQMEAMDRRAKLGAPDNFGLRCGILELSSSVTRYEEPSPPYDFVLGGVGRLQARSVNQL